MLLDFDALTERVCNVVRRIDEGDEKAEAELEWILKSTFNAGAEHAGMVVTRMKMFFTSYPDPRSMSFQEFMQKLSDAIGNEKVEV